MKIPASILLMACICSIRGMAQSHLTIGTDIISELAFRTVRIYSSYGFHHNWSATIEAGLDLGIMHNNIDLLNKEHGEAIGNFSVEGKNEFRKDFSTLCMHLDFWPQKTHKGPCIFFGGLIRDRTGPDILMGLGYHIPIWKGLGIDLRYQIGIIDTYKTNYLPIEGLRGGFHYVF